MTTHTNPFFANVSRSATSGEAGSRRANGEGSRRRAGCADKNAVAPPARRRFNAGSPMPRKLFACAALLAVLCVPVSLAFAVQAAAHVSRNSADGVTISRANQATPKQRRRRKSGRRRLSRARRAPAPVSPALRPQSPMLSRPRPPEEDIIPEPRKPVQRPPDQPLPKRSDPAAPSMRPPAAKS